MVILTVEVPHPWAGLQGRDPLLQGATAVWAANRSISISRRGGERE